MAHRRMNTRVYTHRDTHIHLDQNTISLTNNSLSVCLSVCLSVSLSLSLVHSDQITAARSGTKSNTKRAKYEISLNH